MGAILAIAFAFLVWLPLMMLLSAFVLSTLWTWFLVPLHVPAISMAHAYGIAVLIGYITYQPDADRSRDEEDSRAFKILSPAFRALGALGFGWLALQFM